MSDITGHSRNAGGEWRPEATITQPPVLAWPPRPVATLKWMFGFPGFLWPLNAFWLCLTLVCWTWLTPPLEAMISFEAWWMGLALLRNFGLVLLVFGGLHLYLYVWKGQGDQYKFTDKPLATNTKRFMFRHQVRDNMFRSLVFAVPVITAFEILTLWAYANSFLGLFELSSPLLFWGWFVVMLLLSPLIHAAHFYLGHRLLHEPWLYKHVHGLHHRNVEVGPWSGLAMHPVEHAIYFSTTVVQWLLALHPVNAIYQLHLAIYYAALAHTGFERVKVGGDQALDVNCYFHYLHHKYFECNYGGMLAPFDRIFGTFHDGSDEAHVAMRTRMRERRGAD